MLGDDPGKNSQEALGGVFRHLLQSYSQGEQREVRCPQIDATHISSRTEGERTSDGSGKATNSQASKQVLNVFRVRRANVSLFPLSPSPMTPDATYTT